MGGEPKVLFIEVYTFLDLEEKANNAMDGHIVDFTGIELDTKMEFCLPANKHERASVAVQRHLQRGATSSPKDLQSTLGVLSFCTPVIPIVRSFLRNLFNFLLLQS